MEKLKAKLTQFKKWLIAAVTIIIVVLASFFAIPMLFPPTPSTGNDSARYEYYNTGDAAGAYLYGVYWRAQTFTVGAGGHTVTSVKLKLSRDGSPGTLTVSIRTTDGTHPTGADLTNATIDGNALSTDPIWYDITLTEYSLNPSTKYAIVVRAINGNSSNDIHWREDYTSPTYDDGNFESSGNSGSSWSSWNGDDFMFEVWGNAIGDITPPTYSNVGTNTTRAGQPCLFYAKWTDETGLATTGGFIFGTNNTGAWDNETWTAFTTNPDWSNTTKTLNSTIGVRIEWQIWANDTGNNWNDTGLQYFIVGKTMLFVGWNSLTAWDEDVGRTLAEVNASLYVSSINYTQIGFEYANGTRYEFWFDWGGDATVPVTADGKLYILCNVAGEWEHEYP